MFAPFARHIKLFAAVPLMLVLALALGGCSDRLATTGGDDGGRVGEPTRTPDQQTSAKPDRDRDGVADADDECTNLAETSQWTTVDDGCPDTVDDLMNFAANDIDAFWERTFEAAGERYSSPDGVTAYDGPGRTACGATVPNNAFYCSLDSSIYYDQSLIDESLESVGDFAPVFILAHEWGHYVQDQLGLLNARGRSGIENELQADCFAGLFAQDAESRNLLEPGDVDEALEIAFEAGDPSGAPRSEESHGTSRQRTQAFETGYEGDLEACLAI